MKRTSKRRSRTTGPRLSSFFRPRVEALEDRVLLSLAAPPNQLLPTGQKPLDIQIGRIDNDPTVDLAALGSDGKVTIALNNGDNYWHSVQTYDLGIGPANGLALAPLGTDRFPDLVVQGPNSLTLARNDGTGRFTVVQTLTPGSPGSLAPAGGGRVGMATAFLNNDFFTDLVTVAPGTNEVLVFLSKSDGSFGNPDRYPSGAKQPDVVVVGDFLGTSLPDLAVGHLDGTVTFFQGLPGGKFLPRPDLTVNGLGSVVGMTTGDFDGDGDTEIAVSGTTGVTLLTNHHKPPAVPIANGSFAAGLTGWTATGSVNASGGFVQFQEGTNFLTTLQTTFTVPANPQSLSFDIVAMNLEDPAGGVPDAFEVSLLDAQRNSLVPTFRPEATAFLNFNPGGAVSKASGVTFDGRHATVSLAGLTPGTQATLIFDLVGNPPGTGSTAAVANVQTSQGMPPETFLATPLPGPFGATAAIASGDVDGDGKRDIVVTDTSRNRLVVYNGDGTGHFTRSELDVSSFGSAPLAVAAGRLTAGGNTDDVALTLSGSNRVLNPLLLDTTPLPQVTVLDPAPGQVRAANVNQIRLRFSKLVRDAGPTGDHSVTNPASYMLVRSFVGAGANQAIPLASIAYTPATGEAILVPAEGFAPLPDGNYRLVIKGSDPRNAIQDLAGNPLGGGNDATSTFTVDTIAPDATLTLTPNILWPPDHKFVDIHAQLAIHDLVDPRPAVTLLSITSNESQAGPGNHDGDIQAALGTDTRDFQLRAERFGDGTGRVYTVTYLVRNAAGNGRVVAGFVVVPHDQGHGEGEALLNSLGPPTPPGLSDLQTGTVTKIENGSFQVGTVVSDAIAQPGEVDVWSFSGTAGQRLFFQALAGSSTALHWFLTDPRGTVLFSSDFTNHDTVVLSATGQYFLTVDARSGQTGPYQFHVSNVPAPTPVAITIGQVVSGSLGVPGQQDRYTFTGTAGQRVFFDVLASNGGLLRFTVQGPDGTALLVANNQNQNNRLTLPVNGTYTVVVSHGSTLTATGAYQFQLDNLPADVPQAIAFNTPIAGALTVPGQTVTYTFHANLGQQIVFNVLSNPGNVIGFTLSEPSGVAVFADKTSDQTIVSLPSTGTYTLLVQATGDRIGTYRFQVVDQSSPVIPPRTGAASPTTSLATTRLGSRSVGPIDFAHLQDVTALGRLTYQGTAFNLQTHTLYAAVQLTNLGPKPLGGPVLEVFNGFTPTAARLAVADGFHPDGRPFMAFTSELGPNNLAVGATSSPVPLQFANPTDARFSFTVTLLAPVDRPPAFTSTPVTTAAVGTPYVYAATATDPDGDPLTFRLTVSPQGMTIDPATGRITWTPTANQVGTQDVTLTVSDGRGSVTTQSYVAVVPGSQQGTGNPPPVIVSTPLNTNITNGQTFTYAVRAIDPDNDPLTYSLPAGPAGMSIDRNTGLLTWPNASGGLTQWATSVLGFSSQFSGGAWSAAQALGPPNTFAYGDIGTAWAPGPRNGTKEFITLGYDTPVHAMGVTIRETLGNGFVYQVDVLDVNNVLHTVWAGVDPSQPGTPVDYVVTFPITPYLVKGVKVYVDTDHNLNTWEEIDAVALHSAGVANVTVRVDDGQGGFDTQSFPVAVSPVPPGGIQGTKFNDLNANGVRDQGQLTLTVDSHTTYYEGSDGALFRKVLLPQGATQVQFRVTGGVSTDGSQRVASADGLYADGSAPYNFSGTRYNGTYEGVRIGATTGIDPALFGVFFSPSFSGTPADSLNYRSDSGITPNPRSLLSYSPSVNQPFYIGDGYTSNNPFTTPSDNYIPPGSQQTFNIPAGATYLLLGMGADIRMSDNAGSFTVHALFSNAANAPPPGTITLKPISTPFNNPIAVEYYEPHNSVVATVNYSGGQPRNFEEIKADGTHVPFSNVAGFTDEVYIATARSSDIGGFKPGDLFVGNGIDGQIVRITDGGATVINPWVVFPGPGHGLMRGGLHFDRTGVYGGDLIVVTTAGEVWRVNANGTPSRVAAVRDFLEGVTTVPNDVARYGPLAGKILATAENSGGFYSIDPAGQTTFFNLGVGAPEGIHVIPPNENFFGVDFGSGRVLGAGASQFSSMVGEILLVQEFSDPGLLRVFWDGQAVRLQPIVLASGSTHVSHWEGTNFVPAGINEVQPVLEPGLPGWTIYLDLKGSGRRDPGDPFTVTDANGNYSFTNLAPGTYTVAEEPQAGWVQTAPATRTWTVTVNSGQVVSGIDFGNHSTDDPATNQPPVFTSAAPTAGTVGQIYRYNATAADVDGDTLTFSLVTKPAGMVIDPSAGVIMWVPTAAQVGSQPVVVRVQDNRGAFVLQSFQVNVAPNISGLIITSTPPQPATVNVVYAYQVTASDANGLTPIFALLAAPVGMTIDANSGRITWTPAFADVGKRPLIIIRATDATGQAGYQTYNLEVRGPNLPPTVTSAPITTATAGVPYRYLVVATDGGDPFTFRLVTGPTGMTIDPQTGLVLWQPAAADIGARPVTIRITNDRGAFTDQTFPLTVTPDTEPPTVSILMSTNFTQSGQPVTIQVVATDDVAVSSVALTINGTAVPLDSSRTTVFTPPAAGLVALVATATDPAGNRGTGSATLRVFDPNDKQPPTVVITSPVNGDTVTYLTPIKGTVTDLDLDFYTLEYAHVGTDQFVTFARGTAPVVNGLLGTFDPTLLSDDNYTIRLTAQDVSGNVAVRQVTVNVQGHAKVGNLQLGATDLTIPVAGGPPITIKREYDTLQANDSGDFGYGWRLCSLDPHIFETVPAFPIGEKLLGMFAAQPFKAGDKVYLTNSDCTREGFTFSPVPTTGIFSLLNDQFGTIYEPRWIPDPGVTDTLYGEWDRVALNSSNFSGTFDPENGFRTPLLRLGDGSFILAYLSVAYNPQGFRLLNRDGTDYHYGKFDGLQDITDRNGNVLTVTPDGIRSSSGQGIQFVRDAVGRITQIIDPANHAVTYQYDARGNLQMVTSQNGLSSHYDYQDTPAHFLSDVNSASNGCGCTPASPPVHATYDLAGRVKAMVNALGQATQQTYDLANHAEQVADPLGNVTMLKYDDRGNIVRSTDPLGNTASYTFDASDNLTSLTDPRGNTTRMTYDDRRNLLTTTDPQGNVTTSTYNARNDVTSRTDALGHTYIYTYDAHGNLIALTAPAASPAATATATYDAQGRPIAITDFNGNKTTLSYGNSNKPTQATYADGSLIGWVYNALGLLTAMTDQGGATTRFDWDNSGRLLDIIDPLGGMNSFTYDGNMVASTTNEAGETTTYAHDAAQNLTQIIAPLGHTQTYTYDANGQVSSYTDALGRTTSVAFDAAGHIKSVTDALGRTTRFEYDANGNQTTVIDVNCTCTVMTFDSDNRLLSRTDGLGHTWSQSYDAVGNVISETDANGHTTNYTYDARYRVRTITDALGGVTQRSYDEMNHLISETDANGHTTQYAYDVRNRLIQRTDALGGVRQQVFNSAGDRSAVIDELGRRTTYVHDALHRLVSMTDPAGGVWQTAYDALGQVASTTDPLGRTTRYEHDALNRLVKVTDPAGGIQSYGYDLEDNRTSATDELGRTTRYAYDAVDQLFSIANPDGGTQSFGYDLLGNLTSSTDEIGRTTRFAYDLAHHLVSVTDPRGGVTSYGYDNVGNQTSITDPDGNTTRYRFDALDRVVQDTNALGFSRFFVYDAVGNLTQSTDRNGRVRTFAYDALDRQVSETWLSGGNPVYTAHAGYDAVGNMVSAGDPFSQYAFTFDALNRETRSDNAGTPRLPHVVLQFAYDAVGNRTGVSDNLGVQVQSTYDTRDNLSALAWSGPGLAASVRLTYDAASQLTQVQRFADVAGTQLVGSSLYRYDVVGRPLSITHQDGPGAILVNYQYSYDLAGQLMAESHHGETSTYTYDLDGQLTAAAHTRQPNETFAYDANGNHTESGAVIATDNQVRSDATFDYTYDPEGNLIRKVERATGNVTTLTYDFRNRLTAVETRSGGGVVLSHSDYTYDVFDRLIVRSNNGRQVMTVYDGNHAWADFDGVGTVQARYLFGQRIDQILARWQPGSGVAWYLTDHLGTVRDLVNAVGQIINHLDYDSFGKILAQTNAAAGDRFTFTGREFDFTTGLYYYRARWYDPVLKQFISEDPLGFGGGDVNLRRYVGNHPVMGTDPFGQAEAIEEAVLKQAAQILADSAIDAGCKLLEAWAQDELKDPWGTFERDFWHNVFVGAEHAALATALGFVEDKLACASKAIGKVFSFIGPAANLFATFSTAQNLVYQVYTELTGVYTAAIRGVVTGDYRLLAVRTVCGLIRIAETVISFKMSLPGKTKCGYPRLLTALYQGLRAVGIDPVAELNAALDRITGFNHCFPAGTVVVTESGQRPIESIRAGERVWAKDLRDGRWKLRHVLQTFERMNDGVLLSLKVAGEEIRVTPGHPFWVVQGEDLESRPWPAHVGPPLVSAQLPGRWVDAGELRVGDVLYFKSGEMKPIEQIERQEVWEKVYNFQVEELECYAVGSGQVLVHNVSAEVEAEVRALLNQIPPEQRTPADELHHILKSIDKELNEPGAQSGHLENLRKRAKAARLAAQQEAASEERQSRKDKKRAKKEARNARRRGRRSCE
jgi:RHS repeat-associated protein